jgi:MFS family permease
MSVGFWSLLACRIAMGIGEASIINLATPFIDDVAPPRYKTLWFSIYFTVCPWPQLPHFVYLEMTVERIVGAIPIHSPVPSYVVGLLHGLFVI